jgi:hypothetical protein
MRAAQAPPPPAASAAGRGSAPPCSAPPWCAAPLRPAPAETPSARSAWRAGCEHGPADTMHSLCSACWQPAAAQARACASCVSRVPPCSPGPPDSESLRVPARVPLRLFAAAARPSVCSKAAAALLRWHGCAAAPPGRVSRLVGGAAATVLSARLGFRVKSGVKRSYDIRAVKTASERRLGRRQQWQPRLERQARHCFLEVLSPTAVTGRRSGSVWLKLSE